MSVGHGITESKKKASLLDEIELVTLFQPIVSIKKKVIIGFEALTRGRDPESGVLVPYPVLLERARSSEDRVYLDRRCRKSALSAWSHYRLYYPESLLFLNFDVDLLNQNVLGSNVFLEMVQSLGLDPRSIVIELVEQNVQHEHLLLSFVERYRGYGFLIAIDDFGEASSNLERLFLIRPDIIKISKRLLDAPRYSDEYGKSVLGGVANLVTSLGALVLLEGVESYKHLQDVVDCNIDVIQGYLLAKPQQDISPEALEEAQDNFVKILEVAGVQRMKNIQLSKMRSSYILQEAKHLAKLIEQAREVKDGDDVLRRFHQFNDDYVCMYLLSERGIQISSTLFREDLPQKSALYRPARYGDDHSEKDYYLYLKAGSPHFFSLPYISLATGHFCVTISVALREGPFSGCILCIDFRA